MNKISSIFVSLLRESVLIQGAITLMYGGVLLYMLIAQQEVPKELWALNGIVVGFFFGAKTQNRVNRSKM